MKKWTKNIKAAPAGLAIILIAASLLVIPSAFAQDNTISNEAAGPPYGMGMGKGGPGMGFGGGPFKGLFAILDDDQKEKVTAIITAHREDVTATRDSMMTKQEELRGLIKSDATEATVLAKAEEISSIRSELMKSRISMELEIRALLTDEQKQQFDEIAENMGPGGPGGGKKGKGGGPGMNRGNPGLGRGYGLRDGSCFGQ